MKSSSIESQPAHASESTPLLVDLGDAVDLTLGEGGSGSESKRYEYN